MAEQSQMWNTNGTGDGPSGGYTRDDWIDIFFKLFIPAQRATGGVISGLGGQLAISSGAVDQVTVQDGGAVVYGFLYENTSPINLAITRPVVGTTGGHVVLRVNWAAQTVRLVAVRNTDGLTATPALQQTAGTTWEIRLASFQIATNGTVTVTDVRESIRGAAQMSSAQILSNAILAQHIADANITTPKLANGAVDDAKIGVRGARVSRRRGGNATHWNIASAGSSTAYTPAEAVRIEPGVILLNAGQSITISYALAFAATPFLMVITPGNDLQVDVIYGNETASSFGLTNNSGAQAVVQWLAIGPA